MKYLISFLSISAFALSTSFVMAESDDDSSPIPSQRQHHKRDGDKCCDKHKGKVHQEMLKRFDKDGDGKLDDSERAAAKEAMEARKAERMKKFDSNGDGKLDDEERENARQTHKAEMMKKFDKNGDGKLDEEERDAAKAHFHKKKDGKCKDKCEKHENDND
jgi:hypothetical protein